MNIDYDRAAELQRQIEQAKIEKQARIQNDPDQVIKAAQRELEQLALQEREGKLAQAVEINRELEQECEAAYNAVMEQLQGVLQQLLEMEAPEQLQSSLDNQFQFQRQAIAVYMNAGPADRWRAENDKTNPITSQNAAFEREGEQHLAANRFPAMMKRNERYMAWINAAPGWFMPSMGSFIRSRIMNNRNEARDALFDQIVGIKGAMDILAKEGIDALFAKIAKKHGLNEKSKSVQQAFDFIIENDNERMEAKRAALAVPPAIHQFLLTRIGFDSVEKVYDVALVEFIRDATPAPPPSGAVMRDDQFGGKAHQTGLDPAFGVKVKAMSSADQAELTRRRMEGLGISEYLRSGLSKELGTDWEKLLDGIAYVPFGVKLKSP